MNYQELLEKNERVRRKKNLKDFEELECGECFRKLKRDMRTDYEFLGPVEVDIVGNPSKTKRPEINSNSIYLKKVDNDTCKEVATGLTFKRTYDDNFYNDVTGLYFNFNNYFEKAVGMIIDEFYVDNICYYIAKHLKQGIDDMEARSKAETYMLKKGLVFRK